MPDFPWQEKLATLKLASFGWTKLPSALLPMELHTVQGPSQLTMPERHGQGLGERGLWDTSVDLLLQGVWGGTGDLSCLTSSQVLTLCSRDHALKTGH